MSDGFASDRFVEELQQQVHELQDIVRHLRFTVEQLQQRELDLLSKIKQNDGD